MKAIIAGWLQDRAREGATPDAVLEWGADRARQPPSAEADRYRPGAGALPREVNRALTPPAPIPSRPPLRGFFPIAPAASTATPGAALVYLFICL